MAAATVVLSTAADTAETPVAEVFAVIGQRPIIVVAETPAGAPDNLLRRKLCLGVIDEPHWMTVDKSRQRHLFDRSALPVPREAGVIPDRGRRIRHDGCIHGARLSDGRREEVPVRVLMGAT
jgi:hypothetical protein